MCHHVGESVKPPRKKTEVKLLQPSPVMENDVKPLPPSRKPEKTLQNMQIELKPYTIYFARKIHGILRKLCRVKQTKIRMHVQYHVTGKTAHCFKTTLSENQIKLGWPNAVAISTYVGCQHAALTEVAVKLPCQFWHTR